MPMSPVEQSELAKHVAVVEFVSRCLAEAEVVVPVGSYAPTTAIKAIIKMWGVPTSLGPRSLSLPPSPSRPHTALRYTLS